MLTMGSLTMPDTSWAACCTIHKTMLISKRIAEAECYNETAMLVSTVPQVQHAEHLGKQSQKRAIDTSCLMTGRGSKNALQLVGCISCCTTACHSHQGAKLPDSIFWFKYALFTPTLPRNTQSQPI